MLVRSGAIDVMVVDSVAALTPKAEIEGEMGDHHGFKRFDVASATYLPVISNCLAIFINQIRMKIGVMFGNPETTTGGNAPASSVLDIRRIGAVKDGDEVVDQNRVKVVKNKVAPPFKQTEFKLCTAPVSTV